MTDWASAPQDFTALEPARRFRAPVPLICAVALLASASAGVWFVRNTATVGSPALHVMSAATPAAPSPDAYGALAPIRPADVYGALPASPIAAPYTAPTFAQDTPAGVDVAWLRQLPGSDAPTQVAAAPPADPLLVAPQPAASDLTPGIPVPPPRPTLPRPVPHTSNTAVVAQAQTSEVAPASPAQPSFFEKLFGRPQPSGAALAYAPEDGGMGSLLPGRVGTADRETTAIYDISAHTVVLPNGIRLEAHSGLGASHDDPRSVAEHMHGATPPNVYALDFREAPFHGVRALRLTPVGNGDTYGRGGLLAHSYMLGPRGDSNGCVVFKNYDAFLQAFEAGQVKRLMVVARMD